MMSKLWKGAIVLAVGVVACRADDIPDPPKIPEITSSCISIFIVSPSAATLHPGGTFQFTASGGCTARPTYIWSMNDTTIATVDSTGLVRARAVGTVTVIAALSTEPTSKGAAVVRVEP